MYKIVGSSRQGSLADLEAIRVSVTNNRILFSPLVSKGGRFFFLGMPRFNVARVKMRDLAA